MAANGGAGGAAASSPITIRPLTEEENNWTPATQALYNATKGRSQSGEGGVGVVYKVPDGDHYVAVKVIRLDFSPDGTKSSPSTAKLRENAALQEAQTLFYFKDFNPPIFPKFIAYGKPDLNTVVIIFGFVNGMDLLDLFQLQYIDTNDKKAIFNDPISQKKYEANTELYKEIKSNVPFYTALKDAKMLIQRLHDAGVVHRDIKPENIMVGKNTDGTFSVFLVDAGFAVPIGKDIDTRDGSPAYNPYMFNPLRNVEPSAGHRDRVTSYLSKYKSSKALKALNVFAFNSILHITGYNEDYLKKGKLGKLDMEYDPSEAQTDTLSTGIIKSTKKIPEMLGGTRRTKKRRTAKLTRRRRRRTHRR
jgi:serine/threonine protein kinase